MKNTPTPETDAARLPKYLDGSGNRLELVHADFARKLELERDDLKLQLELAMGGWKTERDQLRKQLEADDSVAKMQVASLNKWLRESDIKHDQLRKVADELASALNGFCARGARRKALAAYNELPHVERA